MTDKPKPKRILTPQQRERKKAARDRWAKTEKAKETIRKYRKTKKFKEYSKKYRTTPAYRAKINAKRRRRRLEDPEWAEKMRTRGREAARKMRERQNAMKYQKEEEAEKVFTSTGHTRLTDSDINRYIEDILKPRLTMKDDPET